MLPQNQQFLEFLFLLNTTSGAIFLHITSSQEHATGTDIANSNVNHLNRQKTRRTVRDTGGINWK